ncbi:carbonic anhydrase [Catellatospora bangladeshensis]|uniref:carbonic anhydrase n=1 Tax=Catellatospora bangladeshensis TaxID=310355 RepID=A0A8J3NM07_9ACTN|nr:carbonic anhydrase [Catellatospora bangladeshensis]GIF84641.1 carbonic anhydrase [Catellatospora bangladeshensis]
MRRRALLAAGLPLALHHPALPPTDSAQHDPPHRTSHALARLAAGNRRFRLGAARHPHQQPHRRHQLATGQHPFVITLGCADSRVAPEIVFDQGLGDVFDNRVAGNIADDLLMASVAYALEHFDPPLLVVLGHERCGAVTAAIDALTGPGPGPGYAGTLVRHLRPAVEAVLGRPGDLVANVVRANIALQIRRLHSSPPIAGRVQTGRLHVTGAVYDLDTGEVPFL